MVTSVRGRLALWHTAVLTILLAVLTGAAYAFVVQANRARTDASVHDALADLRIALAEERPSQASTATAAKEVLRELRFRSIAFAVFDAKGNLLAASVPPPPRPTATEDAEAPFDFNHLSGVAAEIARGRESTLTLPDSEGGYRVAMSPVVEPDGRFTLAAATSLHDDMETLAKARNAIAIVGPVALLLSWVGGWLLAKRSLEPMVRIRHAAARIGAGNLGERVPVDRPDDEVGQLAVVINGLLERLDRSFAQQRQFMADASHELRTPVAVVKNEASLALSRSRRTAEDDQDTLLVVRAAAERLQRIVDDLFFVSRADAGELPVRLEPVYFDELLLETVRQVRSLADARGVTIQVTAPDEVPILGDDALLRRLMGNLLDNAIKYSPPNGQVDVRVWRGDQSLCLGVRNAGPPIPAQVRPRIFDRFARGDDARSHESDVLTGGAGLGLSIAQWIARAHGGSLELARSDQSGTVFVLKLPAPLLAPSSRLRAT